MLARTIGRFQRVEEGFAGLGQCGVGRSTLQFVNEPALQVEQRRYRTAGSALELALIDAGRRVPVTRCSDLVQRLQAARRDLRLPQELAKLDRFDLMLLDDLSYVRVGRDSYKFRRKLINPLISQQNLIL